MRKTVVFVRKSILTTVRFFSFFLFKVHFSSSEKTFWDQKIMRCKMHVSLHPPDPPPPFLRWKDKQESSQNCHGKIGVTAASAAEVAEQIGTSEASAVPPSDWTPLSWIF